MNEFFRICQTLLYQNLYNKIHFQSHLAHEFFLLLAVCNTVIVAKHPHRDTMNASGLICPSSAVSTARVARKMLKRESRVTSAPMPPGEAAGGGDGGGGSSNSSSIAESTSEDKRYAQC